MDQTASVSGKSMRDWLETQEASAPLVSALMALDKAASDIAEAVRAAPVREHTGAAGVINVQGEDQKLLDVITNDLMVAALSACPHVIAMVSEEIDEVIQNEKAGSDANLAVCFDPLDGSTNIETNGTIGTIFSIFPVDAKMGAVGTGDVLAAAGNQVAAGYFLYGPATILVLTTGRSVAIFAEDPATGNFLLTRENVKIPRSASEFSINMAHRRFWEPAVTEYVDECLQGEQGPRAKPFNMRWAGAMVADVHRLFVRGGIFIYPALSTPGGGNGKLRLLYEANPIEMLIEVAGGKALAGDKPVRDVVRKSLHQRVPLVVGSSEEVERLLTKIRALPA